MRPILLDRLFAPVTALPGIGPQLSRLIERAAGPLVVDLLWHLPPGLVDRRAAPPIGALTPRDWPDAIVTVKATVERMASIVGIQPVDEDAPEIRRSLMVNLPTLPGRKLAAN